MTKYRAQIEYNKQNVMRMSNVVCYAFERVTPRMIQVSGICLGGAGLYRMATLGDGLPLLIAAVLIATNADVRGRALGRKMCKFMEGWWPVMSFDFTEREIESHTDREKSSTPYQTLIRLMEDRNFFYLFTSATSAFMVDKKTIDPGDTKGFKSFLCEKTGLEWMPVEGRSALRNIWKRRKGRSQWEKK